MGDGVTEVVETTDEVIIEEESGFLENDPLDALFSDETVIEETVIEKEVVTAPEETGKVIEKEETVVTTEEPEKEVLSKRDLGFEQAYYAEKAKRQALEKPAEEVKKTEFDWKYPEKTLDTMKSELMADNQARFLGLSESQCKSRNKDYDEKYQVFIGMAQTNPAIVQSMLGQADPAQYAYDLASEKMFTDEVGKDPVTYKAKLEAEIRAKIETENKTKADDKTKIIKGLPPSAASLTDKVPINGVQKEPFEALFPGEVPS